MNQKAVETLAVNAVRDSIVLSDYLDQFIPDNDKEPSWDGSVYIYNDKSKKKDKLRGRLPVQVKGTIINDHSMDSISYSVSVVDLNNYLTDGGIIYFVVYIDNKGRNKKIYYAELTPIKLRVILQSAKAQKTVSISLKAFPEDSNKKAMIFFNCFQNCKQQASYSHAKLYSLEELEKQGVLEGVTIPYTSLPNMDPQSVLLNYEMYVYANVKGSSVPQPIEAVPHNLFIGQDRTAKICVGDRQFYDHVKIIKSAEEVIIKIGESFQIVTSVQTQKTTLKYNGTDSLRALSVDLDFMLSYIENKGFSYDGVLFPFVLEKANLSNFDINQQREQLKLLQDTVKLLDFFECKKDLQINDLSKNDWNNIRNLVNAFIYDQPVSGFKEDLPPVASIDIGNLKFLICFKRQEETAGTYILKDFFREELSIVFESMDGNMLPISQYALLRSDDLLKMDNIRYENLLPSFRKIERHCELATRTNFFLLELLLAYDKDNSKKELLTTASLFSDWLMKASEEELPYDVRLLNKLQVAKRLDGLTIDQTKELYQLIATPNLREDVLVGAYLLLDQQLAAEIHFAKMDQQLQEEFKKYPIYHFWKENGGNNNG